MKTIRFAVTLLSAFLMIPTQVAWAALSKEERAAFNSYLKQNTQGNFNDFYRRNPGLLDFESRGLYEAWLGSNGKTPLPKPQAMIIKDKNGNDSLKLIYSYAGRNLTLTFFEGNYETVDVNGKKMPISGLRSIPFLFDRLADHDSSLKKMAVQTRSGKIPYPRQTELLSSNQFARLTPLQRVEYMALVRSTVEAAQVVMDEEFRKTTSQPSESSAGLFALNPLLGSLAAWAQVKLGEECIVAGNTSVYEIVDGRPACAPFPKKFQASTKPAPTFHHLCTGSGKGKMVACNPLLYGTSESGAPHCLDSQGPRFSNHATEDCNKLSPLDPDSNSPNRTAQYRKILESYFKLKNQDGEKIKSCFNEQNQVKSPSSCEDIFRDQLSAFGRFKKDADAVCNKIKLPDQKDACDELRKRSLDLSIFIGQRTVQSEPIVSVSVIKENCKVLPEATYNDSRDACFCPNGTEALTLGDGKLECPKEAIPPVPPIVPIDKQPKEDCKKDDGSQSNSFKCNPAPWIVGALALGGLAWLFSRNKKPSQQVTPDLPGPSIPPGTPTLPPTVTMPPATPPPMPPSPPTTIPPSEGGSGQGAGNSGGVRSSPSAK